ncbi:hypothetical protein [Photobacterium damselae]|uniref:hypothetical protein n=1 Tax=Photobacterium damselae TaxID=38293 RepID=UPI004068F2D8
MRALGVRNPKNKKDEVLKRLSYQMRGLSSSDKIKLAKLSKKYPVVLSHLEPSSANYPTIINRINNFSKLGSEFNLFSLISKFEMEPSYISNFIRLKHKLENYIVNENFEKSVEVLDQIESEYGISLWSIDVRLALRQDFSSPQHMLDYIEKITDDENERKTLSMFFYKHTSSSAEVFKKKIFSDLLKEYRDNGANGYIDMLSTLLLPSSYDKDKKLDDIIYVSEILGSIDKYILYKKVLFEYVVYGNQTSKYSRLYNQFIDEIFVVSNDPFWGNLIDLRDGNIRHKTSEQREKIILSYSKGNYKEAIYQCDEELKKFGNDLSILDIKSKSILFAYGVDEDLDSKNFNVAKILTTNLCLLHSNPARYDSVIDTIESLDYKYHNLDIYKSLLPCVYSSYPFINKYKFIYSCKKAYALGFQVTPKYLNPIIFENNEFIFSIDDKYKDCLSYSRKIRYDLQCLLSEENLQHNLIKSKLELLNECKDIINSEYSYLVCCYYLKSKEYDQLLDVISSNCILKKEDVIFYPLKKVFELINKNKNLSSNISSTICAYLYSMSRDNKYKERTSEIFEDFLMSKSLDKPSEYLDSISELSNKEKFFFEKVCSPEIMSDLICFTSSKELLIERIKIIRTLISKFNVKSKVLLEEEKNIVSALLSHKLTVHHEKNKLNIDVDGLINTQISEYKIIIENLILLSGLTGDLVDSFFDNEKQDNARAYLYDNFYQKVINDFILNPNYGLVRSLSSEIRHGVLPNQIRSVLEAVNLVTIVDIDGEYQSNTYWTEYLQRIVSPDFVQYVDNQLKVFSNNIDELIKTVNSWPRVTTSIDDEIAVFNLTKNLGMKDRFFNLIQENIPETEDDEISESETIEMIRLCEEFIWNELKFYFDEMSKRLNEHAKSEINIHFNSLREKIRVNEINFAKLNQDINKANRQVIEELSRIETWFRKPDKSLQGKFSLHDVLSSSFECIQGIYHPKVININRVSNSLDTNAIKLETEHALGLVRALISIYQNCLKHGVSSTHTSINIELVIKDRKTIIIVKNSISEEKYKYVVDKDYVTKVENFSTNDDKGRLVNEGDTGLYKIYRYLIDSSAGYKFEIAVDEFNFYQKVYL